MTLDTARKIEIVVLWTTGLLILPLVLVLGVLELIFKPINWILEERKVFCHFVGNRLMLRSDAAKKGRIKDPYCLRNYTAAIAYKQLKNKTDVCI